MSNARAILDLRVSRAVRPIVSAVALFCVTALLTRASVVECAAVPCWDFPGERGPNYGGVLILASTGIETSSARSYCGELDLGQCEDAVTRHDGGEVIVVSILAAFNEETSPRLKGVAFGLAYDETELTVANFGLCADYQLVTPDWPASGEGTAVVFLTPQEEHVVEVYWVAMYSQTGNAATLELIEHPNVTTEFADDTIPPLTDCVTDFGSFGFNVDGEVDCPPNTLLGACCFSLVLCEVLLEEECAEAGGNFSGWGSDCKGGCIILAQGACCLDDGECVVVSNKLACDRHPGTYIDGVSCEPNPCQPTPVIDASWGEIKGRY